MCGTVADGFAAASRPHRDCLSGSALVASRRKKRARTYG
jgi:hypothetical protein